MTLAASQVPPGPLDEPHCGCCGRQLPRDRLIELGSTPDIFICGKCARWAAERIHGRSRAWGWQLRLRRLRRRSVTGPVRAAVPILPVQDLARTQIFYKRLGLTVTGRHDGYLVMSAGGVEVHFGQEPSSLVPSSCYVHVDDALRLWKRLRERGVPGVGPVADFDYGMREFVITDPDGNKVRIGSPVPA